MVSDLNDKSIYSNIKVHNLVEHPQISKSTTTLIIKFSLKGEGEKILQINKTIYLSSMCQKELIWLHLE